MSTSPVLRKLNTPKTVIFFGAGASCSEGAPAQSQIFHQYFEMLHRRRSPPAQHEQDIMDFFHQVFDIDTNLALSADLFPTFEEAIGILDLADMKNEGFRQLPNNNLAVGTGKIQSLRSSLLFLLADVLYHTLQHPKGFHQGLVRRLYRDYQIQNITFISTNYDILIDNALLQLYDTHNEKVEYGIDFINYVNGSFKRPNLRSISLLKLHGSLNWLECNICNHVFITPYEKGAYHLMKTRNKFTCVNCEGAYAPVIVPPTFYKDFTKVHLSRVWNMAERALLNAERLIFCGYSFPDADMHIKYLLKRIQKNRPAGAELRIYIANYYSEKINTVMNAEEERFHRFLGSDVDYRRDIGFEEFAYDPGIFLGN